MLLIPFSNIKIKAYLQVLKNLTQFFAYLLFQILKNTLFIIIILKKTIYIKTIIQINKDKAKYIITAFILIIIIIFFLLFIKKNKNYI